MTKRHDWQLLPFILITGVLVGWSAGMLVKLVPLTGADTPEPPQLQPR